MTLLASADVLLRRRRMRLETTRGPAAGQLDHVLDALQAPEFARHLNTDGMPIGAVPATSPATPGSLLNLTPMAWSSAVCAALAFSCVTSGSAEPGTSRVGGQATSRWLRP